MKQEDLLKRLVIIDTWLFRGDRDQAHYLIVKLMEEMYDKRTVSSVLKKVD